ncbi:MAG: ATP-binding cassette domain-containing protein [Desulfovibrio sp.]|nr:ATP-binding cassette domain-containing protein [Desulfovibrio sp.]
MDLQAALLIRDLRRFLAVLPAWVGRRVCILLVLMLVLAGVEVLAIFSMSLMAMSIAAPQTVLNHPMVQALLHHMPWLAAICAEPRLFSLCTGLLVVGCTVLKSGLAALTAWQSAILGEDIAISAGSRMLHHYLYADYVQHLTGDSKAMFQALSWKDSIAEYMVNILSVYTYGITAAALFVALVSATPAVILVCLCCVAGITFAIYRAMRAAIDRAGARAAQSSLEVNSTVMTAMNGIREVLIYQQQPVFWQKYVAACGKGRTARAFLTVAPPIPTWILEIFGFLTIPATIAMMMVVSDAQMPAITAVITIIMLAAWRVLPLLNRSVGCLVTLRGQRPMAMSGLERLEAMGKAEEPLPPEPTSGFRFKREISLQDATFTWPGSGQSALSDISLTIARGEQIGIIGPSGSGKSTLVGLLCGLLPLSGGQMLVDGRELSQEEKAAFARRIGYVPQNACLFEGSVAANVAFCEWGRPPDRARAARACRMAALDLVEQDARGLDYPVGEQGAGLSGGQAQRLVLARALYAEPDLLVLDESTSALDMGTEKAIMQTIEGLRGQLTMVMVAHRLSTVASCDRLVWMEKGRIRAAGQPETILPLYRQSLEQIEIHPKSASTRAADRC